ncbi:hypothetical protein VCRA2128O305_170027 [Vibrio crassostreae]|nr:hypothetical protein VCRA2116O233_150026 [Vibrio crassostreae]CAK1776940.1 hypothetical protein VCRA2113O222_160100 [Vibrio crassostreae]CAK1796041.1 hypothetical protein VCRA2113O206_170107 [Vibrio crassostreae]CAK1796589.1 hypothetical protein VCRA2117O39_160081 [Vibrio crassostreae]CAK1797036.1 hypothetical protein VCRA2113O119_160080 [Vibrio crassostreae]
MCWGFLLLSLITHRGTRSPMATFLLIYFRGEQDGQIQSFTDKSPGAFFCGEGQ